ncbi:MULTISPECIES: hypothetical protein [Haloferax]|uniref:Uncharacterized protein n=1 Tax=Haloferax marinum TaxID=2666143 RepID=A0A6A8GB17_9EURY|nr:MULTISPECIES: hypothetical protein [Haloferax]KAB1190671.1 hypothetical protein Hfx1150_16670 [Haloferax sp. CBA1150]MRW98201.1 hypothetical protein [Haloferax marinum]
MAGPTAHRCSSASTKVTVSPNSSLLDQDPRPERTRVSLARSEDIDSDAQRHVTMFGTPTVIEDEGAIREATAASTRKRVRGVVLIGG